MAKTGVHKSPEHILVIKLGALGDFVQALGPMAAIRRHHPQAQITLLTTGPFEAMARNSGYFDAIHIDRRPKFFDLKGWWVLRRWLRGQGFSRVYDLQNNDRTALYSRLFGRQKPEWVGAARGASHRNAAAARTAGLAFDGHRQTLALAGIDDVALDDLSWMGADKAWGIDQPYILLVPGAAPQHPYKRWPAARYGALACHLVERGFSPVIIGAAAERDIARDILALCPQAVDLSGQTTLEDVPCLARRAAGAIGNDTGPMHLIAPTGCRTLVLFSAHSNPTRHAPLGPHVKTLQDNDLTDLSAQAVQEAFEALIDEG